MLKTKVGSLDVRIVGGDDGRGSGDGPVVVLMHGFGASGDDLVPLAQFLRVVPGIRFVFPEAPLPLPPEMGGFGRMWWPIDMIRLQRAMMDGGTRDMRDEEPPGIVASRDRVVAMIAELRDGLAKNASSFSVGGFSQGSMLACDLAFRTDVAIDSLIILSGTFLAATQWSAGMPARAGLPVFQSHGTGDQVLSFPIAEALHQALVAGGLVAAFHPFRGGHEIPMPVLRELGGFLAGIGRSGAVG